MDGWGTRPLRWRSVLVVLFCAHFLVLLLFSFLLSLWSDTPSSRFRLPQSWRVSPEEYVQKLHSVMNLTMTCCMKCEKRKWKNFAYHFSVSVVFSVSGETWFTQDIVLANHACCTSFQEELSLSVSFTAVFQRSLRLFAERPGYAEIVEWRKVLRRLTDFLRLIDCLLLDMLRRLVMSAVEELHAFLESSQNSDYEVSEQMKKGRNGFHMRSRF